VARAALIPWMHDFARHFGVGQDALHRAVSYADRFLSARAAVTVVATGAAADDIHHVDYQLRLLGAAAVYAASKYEDSGTAPAEEDEREGHRRQLRVRGEPGCAGRGARSARGARVPGRRPHGAHVRGALHEAARRRAGGAADGARHRRLVAVRPPPPLLLLPDAPAVRRGGGCDTAREDVPGAGAARPRAGRRWSRELEGMTGYKPMDVYDGLECMYGMLPEDPGFDISPLLFADPS